MVTAPLSGVPCWVSPDLDLWKGTWVDKRGQNSNKTSPYVTTPCKCRGADFVSFFMPTRLGLLVYITSGPLGWTDLLPLLVGAVPYLGGPVRCCANTTVALSLSSPSLPHRCWLDISMLFLQQASQIPETYKKYLSNTLAASWVACRNT